MGDFAGAPVKIEFVAGARSRGAGTFCGEQLDNYFKLYMKQLRDRLVEILQDLLEENRADLRERWRTSVFTKKSTL